MEYVAIGSLAAFPDYQLISLRLDEAFASSATNEGTRLWITSIGKLLRANRIFVTAEREQMSV